MEKHRAERPAHIESDPRTDGIGDGGHRDLDPLSPEEIQAGIAYDRAHAAKATE